MAARTFFPNGELGRADTMNWTQWREGAKGAKLGEMGGWRRERFLPTALEGVD